MKIQKISSAILITALSSFILPQAQAGLGGLAKAAAGGALTAVTADSLNSDLTSGLDYFSKANSKYSAAFAIIDQAAGKKADAEANIQSNDNQSVIDKAKANKAKAEEAKKNGVILTEESAKLIKEGNEEFNKGIVKWVAIGTSIAVVSQNGGGDAALVAAIPTIQQMLVDLPELLKIQKTMKDMEKLASKK